MPSVLNKVNSFLNKKSIGLYYYVGLTILIVVSIFFIMKFDSEQGYYIYKDNTKFGIKRGIHVKVEAKYDQLAMINGSPDYFHAVNQNLHSVINRNGNSIISEKDGIIFDDVLYVPAQEMLYISSKENAVAVYCEKSTAVKLKKKGVKEDGIFYPLLLFGTSIPSNYFLYRNKFETGEIIYDLYDITGDQKDSVIKYIPRNWGINLDVIEADSNNNIVYTDKEGDVYFFNIQNGKKIRKSYAEK